MSTLTLAADMAPVSLIKTDKVFYLWVQGPGGHKVFTILLDHARAWRNALQHRGDTDLLEAFIVRDYQTGARYNFAIRQSGIEIEEIRSGPELDRGIRPWQYHFKVTSPSYVQMVKYLNC